MYRTEPVESYYSGWLDRPHGHRLYLEQSGNPQGIPVLMCHGGPGGGSSPFQRTLFDPQLYRIVLFDQRGCGQSTPFASISHNTTAELIADIEAIRELLGITRWVVAGGSWGSTLALAYAEQYPQHCLGLILRGIFLGRPEDIDWLYRPGGGASQLFPDYYADFFAPVAALKGLDILVAYQQLLQHPDAAIQLPAAQAWSLWEARVATLLPNTAMRDGALEPESALPLARIENHYFLHHCFLRPNQLLDDLAMVQHLPCYIVHGRYDIVCKMENAWTLHQAWPDSVLTIVSNAGHSASETGISRALYDASVLLARRLGGGC
jgi:proline iminopeptidase